MRLPRSLREHAPAIAIAILALLLLAKLGLSSWQWNDWDAEARPAVDALLAGHLSRFLSQAPAYGGSLILRAPFLFAPKLWGGGELAVFRAAAVPGLAASAFLGVWLVGRMRAAGRAQVAMLLALLLCTINPVTLSALQLGHAEELLGAVLCVAAVLVAASDRPVCAGVLLGLAIANKDWALLAAGPVLLALPGRRPRALLAAGAVVAAVLAPLELGSAGAFTAATSAAAHTSQLFNPWQLWWFLGAHGHHPLPGKAGYRLPPGWLESIAHPLIIVIAAPLSVLYAGVRRHRRASRSDALLLLALLLLLRCALDPWDNTYYPLPFLLALVVWEALECERPPVLALAASALVYLTTQDLPYSPIDLAPDALAAIFLATAVPALMAIARALYLPRGGRAAIANMRQDAVKPVGLLVDT